MTIIKNYLKNILIVSSFILFSSFSYGQNNEEIFIGNKNAKVEIKIYSSFTCPHCANFHKNTYPKLVKEYASKDLIKISFIDFPLDIAALNASKIVRCSAKESSILLIDEIYKNQNAWSAGDKIQEINKKLFLIANKFNLSDEKLSNCLKDQKLEEKILNDRIDGQKKYSINSTPTIIINEKKFEGNLTFENLSKEISDYQPADIKKILNLKLKKYKYKNQLRNLHEGINREWMHGYIAEEVLDLGFEELLGYDEKGEPASLNYGLLSTLVLELVKVQQTEIDSLKEEIQRLKEVI